MITSMYESAKLCVNKYSKLSDFFNSNAGVKQGEPLSPFLFLMYINDVFEHLKTGIEVDFDQLSIFMLMFADDMILISKTDAGLQLLLNQLHSNCNEWNLAVNVNKTNTVIFCKRKSNHNLEFRYGNFVIDIVDSYVYLGVNVNYNGKFKVALETISNQATRAIYGLKKGIQI